MGLLVDVVHGVHICLHLSQERRNGKKRSHKPLAKPWRGSPNWTGWSCSSRSSTACSNFVTKDCKSPAGIRGSILSFIEDWPKVRTCSCLRLFCFTEYNTQVANKGTGFNFALLIWVQYLVSKLNHCWKMPDANAVHPVLHHINVKTTRLWT